MTKIAIDTFSTNHAQSGVGSYILYFISNLPKNAPLKVSLFGNATDKFVYASGRDIEYKVINSRSANSESLWHNIFASSFFKKEEYGAVLFPNCEKVTIPNTKTPTIAILNSVPNFDTTNYSEQQKLSHLLHNLKNATHIITASNCIKKAIEVLGVNEEKITVIYNGIDHKLFYPIIDTSDQAIIKPFSIQKPYFVYGSSLSTPLKKHIELIRAFDIFKEKTNLPYRLVLSGSDGPYAGEVHKAAFEAIHASEIFLTGFFPHENFATLCASSDGCIFPSTIEGAGLPILEAMAAGVPVACSNKGALSEIAGDCALFFDSDNVNEIANSMEVIASDKKRRAELVKAGLLRATNFNWEETVKQTFDVVEQLLK